MASNLVVYTDESWVVNISDNLLHEVEQNSHDDGIIVSVSRVPKSLRSSNPESFIPQFVGLGPYHHYKSDLIMDDKLKLDSSKRALKHFFHHLDTKTLQQRLKSTLSHSTIQAFYHIDVTSKYNYPTLLYLLTVDCLFLLGLLLRDSTTKPQQKPSYFLTGKYGIAMVNSTGVELNMDFIMRDIFMFENQIPTHFLKQVKEAVIVITNKNMNEIESSQGEEEAYQDLGSTMQKLCESLCPFVHECKLPKNPEDHDHLLDLMYHLIVHGVPNDKKEVNTSVGGNLLDNLEIKQIEKLEPEHKITTHKPEDKKEVNTSVGGNLLDNLEVKQTEKLESEHKIITHKLEDKKEVNTYVGGNLLDNLEVKQTENLESEHKITTNKSEDKNEVNTSVSGNLLDNSEVEQAKLEDKKELNTCCSVCGNLLMYFAVVCMIIYFIIKGILTAILWILKTLFRFIKWTIRPLVKLSKFIHPFVETLYDFLSENQNNIWFMQALTTIVGEIKKTSEKIGKEDYSTHWDHNSMVTIQSVTELHNAGIKFQPSDKGKNVISSIDFDEIKCQFYLPVIKLDVNSEVIIRNLMAYESLSKPKRLIFTRYMELMGAIIDTPEDVKLLNNAKIIETELSYEVVAKLFNGLMMEKSIRPTRVENLDKVIKMVNAKFKSTQGEKMVMIKYMSSYGKMLTAFAAIVFLVLTAVQTYCSAFGCARNSNFSVSSSMHQDGEYVRNNLVMASI